MNKDNRQTPEATTRVAKAELSDGGQLAWLDELAAKNPVETDEDDEYLKMLTLIGRSEALDTRVAVHEICHYLIDRINGTDRIVQVSITPNERWEGVCVGKQPKAFTKSALDASDLRAMIEPVMPVPGEDHSSTSDVVQSVLDTVTELMAGEVGERLVLGSANAALDDRRQACELASLICKSEASVNRFIAFCEQQAADLLAPHAMIVMSLQIILRMRRDMTGQELDQAAASVLANFELAVERRRRTEWRQRELSASSFERDAKA
jgi:hypothetical protein